MRSDSQASRSENEPRCTWVIPVCPTCGGLPEPLGDGRRGCGRHRGTTYEGQFGVVAVVEASRLEAAEGERDRLHPIVAHVAGLVAPELGYPYGKVHREVIYAARAALSTGDRQDDDSHVRAAEATQPAQARHETGGGST